VPAAALGTLSRKVAKRLKTRCFLHTSMPSIRFHETFEPHFHAPGATRISPSREPAYERRTGQQKIDKSARYV
jgi:hypothetical protein